ncbi:MAG: O-antigen ligase family protein [Pseudomonadota bacterium]
MSEIAPKALVQGKTAQRISAALLFFAPLSLAIYPGLGSTWTALVFLWGLILWASPGSRPTLDRRECWFLWSSFGLFAVAALSLTVALDLDEGVSDLGRYAHFLLLIPLYLGLRRQDLDALTPLAWGGALTCLLFAGWAWHDVGEYGWSEHRAEGFYNAISFGQYAAVCLCLSFALPLFGGWRWLQALIIAGAFYAVIQSQSRGVWLALLVAPVVLAWIEFHWRGRLVATALGTLVLLLLVWGAWANWPGFDVVARGVDNLWGHFSGNPDCSTWSARLQMWHYVIMFWQQHPLLGSGLGGYTAAVHWLVEQGAIAEPCRVGLKHHAHSNLFQVLMVMGSLGLLAFVNWFLAAGAVANHHSRSGVRVLTLAVILVVFLFGLSEAWLAKSLSVKFFLVVMVALLASKGMGKNASPE